jgi:hypothetical protein
MGYGPDTDANIAQARQIMQKLGYSDVKPLPIKIQTRNLPTYRDAAVILTDQLKKIHIVGELDVLETPQWYARLARKDYTIGLNVTGVSVDDPDGNIVENYSCKSERNYTRYCNAEVDGLLAAQSRELDKDKRRKIVWEIERLLVDDAARPIIISSVAANCWQPWSWIDSSRKREALTISCPGPGIASLRRCKAGPGQKIAKTTPCKVEWTPARSTLAALRPGQKKGPNLISSRI